MPIVSFTPHLKRHLECPPEEVSGETLGEAFHQIFELNPQLRGYVLDDQGALRQHVVVFIDDAVIRDRKRLSDPVNSDSKIFVMQALSGG